MKKVLVIGALCLVLVSCVYVSSMTWSNPSVEVELQSPIVIKPTCDKDEWNNNFEGFREGLIAKEEMKVYVRSCKW